MKFPGIASKLKSLTSLIGISTATAPTTWQVLTAVSSTEATWQTPDTRRNQRYEIVNNPASYTFDLSLYDHVYISGQAQALLFNNPIGSPAEFNKIMIRIKDNGTARAITYWTKFQAWTAPLITSTVISKYCWMWFEYNWNDDKWYCLASWVQP